MKTFLLLVLALLSTIYYLQKDLLKKVEPHSKVMMAMTPLVPSFPITPAVLEPKKTAPVVKEVVIAKNQTFSELMQMNGIDNETIQQIFDSSRDVYNLSRIAMGRNMTIMMTPQMVFSRLEYSIDPLQTLIISKNDEEIRAEMQKLTPEVTVHELGGYIEGSLYSTIDRLGEGDELVIRFAEIFEWDVDFFKDLQAGDSFRMIYERTSVEGTTLGYGKILAAELVNKGQTYTALGYQRGANMEYFSADGKAMKKAFLAAPIKFSRISSGFTTRRYHPILKKYRPHYGTDYAAPTGTPVRTIGKGRVIFAGWAGGAGKTIKIEHDREITTVYCHLSRFGDSIRKGASVSQGQVIGYVGSTGLSTAPHLDFRFMKNGKYVNFLSIKSPQAEPLSNAEIVQFKVSTAAIAARLLNVSLQKPNVEFAYLSPNPLQLSE